MQVLVIMASYKREKKQVEDTLTKAEAAVGLVHLPTMELGIPDESDSLPIEVDDLNVEEEALLKKVEEVPLEKLV